MLSSRLVWLLSSLSIGIYFQNAESRLIGEEIVGGELAQEGQFPYQVYVYAPLTPDYICGGAIIDENHVVTAAHCVIDSGGFFETALKVKVGVIDGTRCTDDILVERIAVPWQFRPKYYLEDTIPKKYVPGNFTHDIAVLTLSRSLDLSPESPLKKVKLPEKVHYTNHTTNRNMSNYPSYAGKTAMISGYGWTNVRLDEILLIETGTTDKQLRFVESKILSKNECQKFTSKDKRLVVCAKAEQQAGSEDKGVCSADSGGPLVVDDTLVGVLSLSPKKCIEKNRPATYTRVSAFMGFIKNAISGNFTLDAEMRVAEISIEYKTVPNSACSEQAKKYWDPEAKYRSKNDGCWKL